MVLPKVLIIGQTFNNTSGGGITQSNLFSGWDPAKLAVTCTAHLLRDSDFDICGSYYQLGQGEHKWAFPFNYLQRKFPSGVLKFDQSTSKDKRTRKSNFRSKMVDGIFFPFLKYSGLIHWISKIELSRDFCNWLDDFNPDIIYAQGQDRERILFILLVHSYLKKPLIFHVMDDWPSTISDKGLFKRYWYKKIDYEFRTLLNKATLLMGISDAMANEYKIRYNKNFITFHNPITIDFWRKTQKTNYRLGKYPTILYAGRIGLGIKSSLELIAQTIQSINEELDMSIKFTLQTAEKPLWSNKYLCVEHRDLVGYNDLPSAFSKADILILPYDFSLKSIKYIQYSMPTKAPEYMISGTPIIVFAPETTAIVKYAEKYEWAKIVVKNKSEDLSLAIKDLIQNQNLREKISRNAKKIAEEKHNSKNVANEFKNLICSLIPSA
ncbi:MAG TPA: glycosyltransferase [Verrucomicrobiae bacterium]|nr:glycosyltransferase [Verrucomicrobiae bacterium]